MAVSEFADGDGSRIRLLDRELEPFATERLEGRHVLFARGVPIYAASERGFYVLGPLFGEVDVPTLAVAGDAPLPPPLQEKEMDGLLVHDDIAYIVDDVLFPRYLLRVDVTDPFDPTYLEVVEIGGVNQTLTHQWLEPERNRWRLVQSTSTMAGDAQHVLTTPMTGADSAGQPRFLESVPDGIDVRSQNDIVSEPIYRQPRDDGASEGVRLHDITATPPIYASVTADDGHYLSRVETDPPAADRDNRRVAGDSIGFGREVELESPAFVAGVDETIVVLAREPNAPTLSVFDGERETATRLRDLEIGTPVDLVASVAERARLPAE